ncbi:MAG: hypothetical protein GX998_01830 [Firmicutes bacterium]|nr:hypothetical protein [Bacillota bacterium]
MSSRPRFPLILQCIVSQCRSLAWQETMLVLTLIGLTMFTSGCFGGLGQTISYAPNGPTGGVAVKALLTSDMAHNHSISRVTATLTRGKQEVQQDLVVDLTQMTASGRISKLLVGTWQLRVDVFGRQGEMLYSGTTSVWIDEDQTTGVDLPLLAAPGTLVIALDLGGFGRYELVKGKIIIGTGEQPAVVKEFIRDDASQLIVTIDELPPHTHDLRIELYENTFHSYNRFYESPWEVITIQPGKTTAVEWNPAWGCVEIIGMIDAPPPSPKSVNALLHEDGILVSWDAVAPIEDDLKAYRLYTQLDVFAGFQLIATVPASITSYLYQPDLSSHPEDVIISIELAVSSIDHGGNESTRSSPVTISWPVRGSCFASPAG